MDCWVVGGTGVISGCGEAFLRLSTARGFVLFTGRIPAEMMFEGKLSKHPAGCKNWSKLDRAEKAPKTPQERCKLSGENGPVLGSEMRQSAIQEAIF